MAYINIYPWKIIKKQVPDEHTFDKGILTNIMYQHFPCKTKQNKPNTYEKRVS